MYRINTEADYHAAYAKSIADPTGFWADIADTFVWRKPYHTVLSGSFAEADVQWFAGGQLNITENCIDRHLAERGAQTAFIWERNDPRESAERISYRELHARVCRFANVLKANGAQKGDRICIYMPMIPDLAIALLACARIGAVHSVVFAGFSATAIADRVNDAGCTMILTADGMTRGAKTIAVKAIVDAALPQCPTVRCVIVTQHTRTPVTMQAERDIWLHEALAKAEPNCPAEPMESEDPLFILYTSGSTGKPKGVVHTCGGYMVYADYTFRNVFQYRAGEVFWCTADIGWVTGHTYLTYAPLLAGATSVLFEGIPTYPDAGRFWEVIARHRVNIFYTAPTAIRSLMQSGTACIAPHDLSSLRVLGSVGEPINEEAWHWYHTHIGKGNCPIVDTWWQTETGGIMLSALAGVTPTKPTHAGLPLPGILPVLLDAQGNEIHENEVEGYLAIAQPWPAMIRTTYGDHARCRLNYFAAYPNYYFTGDGARRDANGLYRIIGRVDDVINVSGHRFGTAEIENAINQNPLVVESAVVGYPHDLKGQGIYAYVICQTLPQNPEAARIAILNTVTAAIGGIAKPDKIQFVVGLPKTRSGKIMRRILRKIAEGDTENLGDTTTLLDPTVVESIKLGAL